MVYRFHRSQHLGHLGNILPFYSTENIQRREEIIKKNTMLSRNKLILFFIFLFFSILFFYLKFSEKISLNDVNSIKNYTEKKIKNEEYTNSKPSLEEKGRAKEVKSPSANDNLNIENKIPAEIEDVKKEVETKNYIKMKVPFISQAPTGKWDRLHEEACEEASLLIVKYYFDGRELILSGEADTDILKMDKYVKNNFSEKEDLNVSELKKLAENYFELKNSKILKNPKREDMEKELNSGNLIIAPMAGRELNNPFFKTPGPLYHMLVISGYDRNKDIFFTQDPGTKRGADFTYPTKTIMNALHDFPGKKEDILSGEKNILVFQK